MSLHRLLRYGCLLTFTLLQAGAASALDQTQPSPQLIQTQIQQLERRFPVSTGFERQLLADGIRRLYAARQYQPLWERPGELERLLLEIENTADDGLIPQNYQLAELQHLVSAAALSPRQRACRDLLATRAYLLALTHLAQGQIDAGEVEPLWYSDKARRAGRRNVDTALRAAAAGLANGVSEAFEQARPRLPLYASLRQAHAELRRNIAAGAEARAVPPGESLRLDSRDERVPLLRQRLGVAASPADPLVYDPALADAVKRFQRSHYLEDDGIVGKATLGELNMPLRARLDQLRVNLERARWLAREIEPHMVLVDIAGAEVVYYRNGVPEWRSRAQVGTPARATPALKSQITHFSFNPPWTVPPTILRNDKLPRIRKDPDYLRRHRYRVFDSHGNELSPAAVNWSRPGGVILRQDPGPGNALGQVAIRFPNPNAVYLHDTPSKRLFERGQRTFSSGCVRVEDAMGLVNLLIRDAGDTDGDKVQRIIDSGKPRNVSLIHAVPVLLAYWTAAADDSGEIRYRPDIYHHDARLLKALPRRGDAPPPSLCAAE